jgi:hypothetical protein
LYVSLLAEFNSTNTENKVTFWDDIYVKDDAHIKIKKKSGKYRIHDLDDRIKYLGLSRDVKSDVVLQYNIVPWVGFMRTERIVFDKILDFK